MATTKYINATLAYDEFRIPRSALRDLSEAGIIERVEKTLYGDKVMFLYSRKDIEKYINEK